MPVVVAWIIAGISRIFASRLGSWIAGSLVFLGLSLGTSEFLLDPILMQIKSLMGSLAGDAIGWVSFFNLDKYISAIVSAYAVAAGKKVVLRRRAA